MSLLYLVGSVHWDLRGPERLRKFLGFVRPSYICLEASEQTIEQTLSERIEIKAEIEQQRQFSERMKALRQLTGCGAATEEDITMDLLSTAGYETWVAYEHKNEDNPSVTIVPMHSHQTILTGMAAYKEGFGPEYVDEGGSFTSQFAGDLAATDRQKFQEVMDGLYLESKDFFASNPEVMRLISSIRMRDDEIEPRLRGIAGKNQGTTVFVCGSHHFFGDYGKNLYERVKDLSPVRLKLIEVDKY